MVSNAHEQNVINVAKHIEMVLHMSRPLFVGSYLQVTWWAHGQWNGRKNAWNDNNGFRLQNWCMRAPLLVEVS